MDIDGDEYVLYGTPIKREEDLSSRKQKKQAIDQGRLRLTSSTQEVYDENGRRRFHGAFTGGFSAGYYNTVGSKEGWTPQKFTSSRKNRTEVRQQRAYDFMDADEKEEQDSARLATSSDFDTFGFTAAEFARKEAEHELKKRPSAIPGLLPDEIIVPVSRSIGIELLRKMGWRHGRAIGPKHIVASSDIRKEGRKALLAFAPSAQVSSNNDEEIAETCQKASDQDYEIGPEDAGIVSETTLEYVINPKKDRYGFGFDPFKNAPEFRERRHAQDEYSKSGQRQQLRDTGKPSLFRPYVGRMGGGFGIGALEELDVEDEDVYAPGLEMEIAASDEESLSPKLKVQKQPALQRETDNMLPGFKPASSSTFRMELFPPPTVPPGFDYVHKFKETLESERVHSNIEPAEAAAPEDIRLRKLIDGLATFVARSGQKLENLYMEKRSSDPMFKFLFEGSGHDYYKRRLWEEHKKIGKDIVQKNENVSTLDSAKRGQILGETPLQRSSLLASEDHARLQSALASAFTRSACETADISDTSKPFSSDAAKQARFEQFLKDKYEGGLRKVDAVGRSEWERAQETIEFEAACQNLQRRETKIAASGIDSRNLQSIMNDRFVPQTLEKEIVKPAKADLPVEYPKREENPWRPTPLVCKRFNLSDPYAGKPPPLPKARSRTESFIFLTSTPSNSGPENKSMESTSILQKGDIEKPEAENISNSIIEKPVDLFKAIFSDDSDEENDEVHETTMKDKSGQAAQAALIRLEAGDFLASVGRELGFKVPPTNSNIKGKTKEPVKHVNVTDTLSKEQPENTKLKQLSGGDSKSMRMEGIVEEPESAAEVNLVPEIVTNLKGKVDGHSEIMSEYSKVTTVIVSDEMNAGKKSKGNNGPDKDFFFEPSVSSEECTNSSDESSDGSERRKKSKKRRKKDRDRRYSRKHKDRSRDHHKSRRSKDEDRSRHHHHKSRK